MSVDTRMDLWRLVAHANVCVDLAPGPHIARECVEALRFGTPIIVPEHSGPAEVHAREGGGSTFGDPGELVAAAGKMRTEANRSAASAVGRRYADSRFGDPLAVACAPERTLTRRMTRPPLADPILVGEEYPSAILEMKRSD